MKEYRMFVFLMAITALLAFADAPIVIELDYFNESLQVPLGSDFPIYYMWSSLDPAVQLTEFKLVLFHKAEQHCTPAQFVGLIAQNIPLGKPGLNQTGGGSPENGGVYHWKAGQIAGGGLVPAGKNYCVLALTMDGQVCGCCYSIWLSEHPVERAPASLIRKFLLARDPGCPMCGIVDIGALLAHVGQPPDLRGNLVLLRDGRKVAELGRLEGRQRGQTVHVRFAAPEIDLIRRGGQGFVLAIIGDSGRSLFSKPIQLKFNN